MLYLINTNNYYKVGYTKDAQSLLTRVAAYKTHSPEVKILGIRQGNKKEEKRFNLMFGDTCKQVHNTEWYCVEDVLDIKNILYSFTEDADVISHINPYIDFEKEDFPEDEIHIEFIIDMKNARYHLYATETEIYLFNAVSKTNYRLDIDNFKLFSIDYKGAYYGGLVLNNSIVYNKRIDGGNLGDVVYILNESSDFYKTFKEEILDASEIWHDTSNL
jgi:hypothetical protein